MADEQLGFTEGLSFALGGIIGGGIFAVLGVVAKLAGPTAWIAYFVAGVVALTTVYSYVALNRISDDKGGAVTLLESFVANSTVAGTVGWALIVGYIGTVAMYGYAFGAYFAALFGLEHLPVVGLPTRPVASATVVLAFVGVNLVGVRESGIVEDLLVAAKLLIVALFGVFGIWFGYTSGRLVFGFASVLRDPSGPIVAAAVSFVSFEGWQLLFYDRESFRDPDTVIPKSIFASIPISTLVYVVVAFVTISLVSRSAVVAHPDVALALAAEQFLGRLGYLFVGLAAVASTASAINATLFSTALFAKGMSSDGLLPDQFAGSADESVPTEGLLVIGLLTTAFTVYGSLAAITEFASLAFLVVFGVMNALAVTHRDHEAVTAVVPVVGLLGVAVFLPLFVWHLVVAQFDVFVLVVGISVTLLIVEVLYFERTAIEEGVFEIAKRV